MWRSFLPRHGSFPPTAPRGILRAIAAHPYSSSSSTQDLYKILDITKSATEPELKAAYRKQAMQFHPDRNSGNKQAEEKFKQISMAYDILSDPIKRADYDHQFQSPFRSPGSPAGQSRPPSPGFTGRPSQFAGFPPGFDPFQSPQRPSRHGNFHFAESREFTTADAEKLFRDLFGERAWTNLKEQAKPTQKATVVQDPFGNTVHTSEKVGIDSSGRKVIRTTKSVSYRTDNRVVTSISERPYVSSAHQHLAQEALHQIFSEAMQRRQTAQQAAARLPVSLVLLLSIPYMGFLLAKTVVKVAWAFSKKVVNFLNRIGK